ncbi:MAG: MATE family efflux transporter [Bacteroidota bacterium]|nr:MATE family efflux transporter [Bacteroidota bacterium]
MNRKILRLAIPSIISNISIPLLGMVDLALVGHLEGIEYIGGLALGTMIFNFIYWGFGFLRMGTTGLTSQAYGSRNLRESILILSRSLLIGGMGGLFILLLQKPIAMISFYFLEGSEEVEILAREYFYIRIWAAPATLGLYSIMGWFIGMQNTRFPMIITIFVNLLNLGFNLFFVFYMGMKSDGVALGTVLAQYGGLLLSFILYWKYYRKLNRHWSYPKMIDARALKKFFSLNKDIFIRTLFLIFAFSFFTAKSATMGNEILAINTLLLQYFMFFSYLIDGFAYAAEALSGKYIGARDTVRLKQTIVRLFVWGALISIPFSLSYFAGGKFILGLLTNNHDLIESALPYLFWVALVPVITFPAFLFDGIFIGATASTGMRNSMIIATLLFYLPVYYLLKNSLGNHGLWLAFMCFMIGRGVLMWMRLKKEVLSNE